MQKNHKVISIIIGLLFLVTLQVFSQPQPIFRFLAPAFLIYVLAVWLYNDWFLRNLEKQNFWLQIRPMLLLVSLFGIFLLLPSQGWRSLFLIISVILITFFEYFLNNFSEHLLVNESLIIIFGLFVSLAAFMHFFPGYRFISVIGSFVVSGLIARFFYETLPKPENVKVFSSLVLGLFTAETLWALSFLPFHFSVIALILFNIFYFSLILNYYYSLNILSLKKMQFHIVILFLTSGAVLLSTPWRII